MVYIYSPPPALSFMINFFISKNINMNDMTFYRCVLCRSLPLRPSGGPDLGGANGAVKLKKVKRDDTSANP